MNLPDYLKKLDKKGLLKKISIPVDPELEITEIVNRLYQENVNREGSDRFPGLPVLLFENVKGSTFPLAINLFGGDVGLSEVLGQTPEQLGNKLSLLVQGGQEALRTGKILSWLWKEKNFLLQFPKSKPNLVNRAPFKEVRKRWNEINLHEFPILKCWPKDGGKFITAGLSFTKSPKTGAKNIGIYRLQVLSSHELLFHAQIQKGGGFHYLEAEELNQPLEIAIVIGCDPLLWFGGVLPLPEGLDELAFTSFLRGESMAVTKCDTVDLEVPANAEIVIEGVIHPKRRELEGPFGDHFGHYSHASPFPVIEIKQISHKKEGLFHAAVVGKPPQEDKIMGEAVTKIFAPLLKAMRPELVDVWPYYEAGFHNLIVASVKQRYEKEGVKTALSLLGDGQLSLSKCVILVDPEVDVKNFNQVVQAIGKNFDPAEDFILLPGTSQDTLDFTGPRLNSGSKMIVDATGHFNVADRHSGESQNPDNHTSYLDSSFRGKDNWKVLENTFLVIKTKEDGKKLVKELVQNPQLQSLKIIAVVSEDVPLEDDVLLIWGIFTRFDCQRDIYFAEMDLQGACPRYNGVMGIDATWKKNYPPPVEMSSGIVELVSKRWKGYGF